MPAPSTSTLLSEAVARILEARAELADLQARLEAGDVEGAPGRIKTVRRTVERVGAVVEMVVGDGATK